MYINKKKMGRRSLPQTIVLIPEILRYFLDILHKKLPQKSIYKPLLQKIIVKSKKG